MIATTLSAAALVLGVSLAAPDHASSREPASVSAPSFAETVGDRVGHADLKLASNSIRNRSRSIRRQFTLRGGKRTKPRGRTGTHYGRDGSTSSPAQPVTVPPATTRRANPVYRSGPKRMRADGLPKE